MRKTIFAMLLMVILFSGCAKKTIYIKIAPPRNKTEIRSERPGVKHVWVEGRWQWNRKLQHYEWVSGRWIKKKDGRIWIRGSWDRTRRGWLWTESYWK